MLSRRAPHPNQYNRKRRVSDGRHERVSANAPGNVPHAMGSSAASLSHHEGQSWRFGGGLVTDHPV